MHAAASRHSKLTAIYLFSDIVSAYCKARRELVLSLNTPSGDIGHILESLQIPVTLVPVVVRLMQEPTLITHTGASAQLQEVINDSHRNSWFTVSGTHRCVRSRADTRPGNPLAYLLVALIADPAFDEIGSELHNAGLLLKDLEGPCAVYTACYGASQRHRHMLPMLVMLYRLP